MNCVIFHYSKMLWKFDFLKDQVQLISEDFFLFTNGIQYFKQCFFSKWKINLTFIPGLNDLQ